MVKTGRSFDVFFLRLSTFPQFVTMSGAFVGVYTGILAGIMPWLRGQHAGKKRVSDPHEG